jgi:hypothetical protein
VNQTIASRARPRRVAIVAASLVGHGLVLVLLGLTARPPPPVRMSEPDVVALDIWMPTRIPVRRSAPTGAQAMASPLSPRRARPMVPSSDAPTLSLPVPAGPTGPAPESAAGAQPAPLPSPDRDGLRRALRGSPVGCSNRDIVGLTRREREACDDAYARGRAGDPFIEPPMDARKRAAFDAEAARKERIRKRKEAPPPHGITPSDNAGGTRTNGIGILGY